jgi:NAD(P)-dependent dehydrogenase (short-subunit alcohol dehydrogenase family)
MAKTVYVVTGAARGIGREFVNRLLQQQDTIIYAGVRSLASPIDLLINKRLFVLECDITSDSSVTQFVKAISREEKVDILINNAGIDLLLPIHETSVSEFEMIMQTNLVGIHRTIPSLLPFLLRSPIKMIVNNSQR